MSDTPVPVLPPEEAIRFFTGKGLAKSFSWHDIWTAQHDYVFTVAKMLCAALLEEVHGLIGDAEKDGRSPQQLGKELKTLLAQRGWWGRQRQTDPLTGEEQIVQLGSNRRVRTIVNTNLRTSYAAGRYERQERTRAAFPILVYKSRMDGRERQEHHNWHDTALPFGHVWWRTHYPPCDWGCRCRTVSMTEKMAQRRGLKVGDAPYYGGKRRWVNKRTGEVTEIEKGIGAGWDYHPGRARLEGIAPEPLFGFSQDGMAISSAAPAALDIFLARFGAEREGRIWRDATGWPLAISPRWLRGLPINRQPAAATAMVAVQEPEEIRLLWVTGSDGRAMLTRRYIGAGHVVDVGNRFWRFAAASADQKERLRKGIVIWRSEPMAIAAYNPRQPRDRNGRWIGIGGGMSANFETLLAGQGKQVVIGEVADSTARLIAKTGADARGKLVALDPSYTRHIMQAHGGAKERLRGQLPITRTDLRAAAMHLNRSRNIGPADSVGRGGHPRFVASNETGRSTLTIVGEVRKRRVIVISMWKRGK